jgi:hypothetical protein
VSTEEIPDRHVGRFLTTPGIDRRSMKSLTHSDAIRWRDTRGLRRVNSVPRSRLFALLSGCADAVAPMRRKNGAVRRCASYRSAASGPTSMARSASLLQCCGGASRKKLTAVVRRVLREVVDSLAALRVKSTNARAGRHCIDRAIEASPQSSSTGESFRPGSSSPPPRILDLPSREAAIHRSLLVEPNSGATRA